MASSVPSSPTTFSQTAFDPNRPPSFRGSGKGYGCLWGIFSHARQGHPFFYVSVRFYFQCVPTSVPSLDFAQARRLPYCAFRSHSFFSFSHSFCSYALPPPRSFIPPPRGSYLKLHVCKPAVLRRACKAVTTFLFPGKNAVPPPAPPFFFFLDCPTFLGG